MLDKKIKSLIVTAELSNVELAEQLMIGQGQNPESFWKDLKLLFKMKFNRESERTNLKKRLNLSNWRTKEGDKLLNVLMVNRLKNFKAFK